MKSLVKALGALRKVLLVGAVVGLLGGAGWGIWHWQDSSANGAHFKTERAARGPLTAVINASGTLVPEEVIDVGAQVAGQIISFGRDLDDSRKFINYCSRVEKDTVLAQIDDALYAADVDIAEADLKVAEADVLKSEADLVSAKAKLTQRKADWDAADATRKQAQDDLRRGESQAKAAPASITRTDINMLRKGYESASAGMASADAAIKDAQAAVKSAEAALEKNKKTVVRTREALKKARRNLDYCTIKSPVKGVIVDRRVNIGQTVVSSLTSPSLFLIAKDLKRMQVWATVNEADIGRLHTGQTAYFKVDAHPNDVFTGTVIQIRLNATMTQNVVTYTVVVETNNESGKLLPYLTANLQFQVDHRPNTLMVPNSALRYRPPAPRVGEAYRAAYAESMNRRRPTGLSIKPNAKARRQPRATVWVEEDGFVKPIKIRTGLTDGAMTEVVEVSEGELAEGTALVTGETQAAAAGGASPFTPKLFNGKK